MRKFVYAVSILAFSISASAQQVVDTSEKNVDAQLLRKAISALSNQVKDPLSIQIRNLKMGLDANTPTLCGEFNAKNSFGGYVGFSPFFYRKGAEAAGILDPRVTSAEYAVTADNALEVLNQSFVARRLEQFGCIEAGLSNLLDKKVNQALGK